MKNATTSAATAPMISTRHQRAREMRKRRDSHATSGVNAAHTYHSVAAIVSVYRQRGGW